MSSKEILKQNSKNRNKKPFFAIMDSEDDGFYATIKEAFSDLNIPFIFANGENSFKDTDIVLFFKYSPEIYKKIIQKGCVPICPVFETAKNYDPIEESGNGFYFERKNIWEILEAVIRACETYQFPYDWQNLLTEIQKPL